MTKFRYAIFVSGFCFFLLFMPFTSLFALEQNIGTWIGANTERYLSADKKWNYLFYTQTRFLNVDHPWRLTLLEGGVGYSDWEFVRVWAGYRWTAITPTNGFTQDNRLWQQLVWTLKYHPQYKVFSRTRMEEGVNQVNTQYAYRLRQRILVEWLKHYFGKLDPKFYDEIILRFDNPGPSPYHLFDQNRLFLGFNIYTAEQSFWEVGYMNQYQLSTPQVNQAQMNHLLVVNYNWF